MHTVKRYIIKLNSLQLPTHFSISDECDYWRCPFSMRCIEKWMVCDGEINCDIDIDENEKLCRKFEDKINCIVVKSRKF